jgi:hypothetical protein
MILSGETMAKHAVRSPAAAAELVELQSQLVELALKNEQAEQQCDALWRELERTARGHRLDGRAAVLAARLARWRHRLAGGLLPRMTTPARLPHPLTS